MKQSFTLYLFIALLITPALTRAQISTAASNKQAIDTELVQSKIMLLDATLDLNQALLQGIKASLDSLNVKDKGTMDEKNIQATIRSMQRRRDKALLTPTLLHMQDSLNTEITKEQTEKASLENTLGIKPKTLQPDTVIIEKTVKTDTATPVKVIADTANKAQTPIVVPPASLTKDTVVPAPVSQAPPAVLPKDTTPLAPISVAQPPTVVQPINVVIDTVAATVPVSAAKDTTPAAPLIQAPLVNAAKDTITPPTVVVTKHTPITSPPPPVAAINTGKQSHDTAAVPPPVAPVTFDSLHIRPVIEASTQPEAVAVSAQPVRHWQTAHALYGADDTTSEWHAEAEPAEVDTQTLQNSRDSGAYIPSVVFRSSGGGKWAAPDSVSILKAEMYLIKARKNSNERSYKAAAEDIKKSLDLRPGYYDAWLALGEADAHLGLYTKALNEFKTCAAIDSTQAPLFNKMANMQLKLKQRDEAFAYFNKSLLLDSNYIPAIMGRALIFAERKEYKTAIAEYSRVLNIDRGYHSAYKAKAMAEYWMKSYDAAIDDFTRFMIFDETDPSIYYFRGLAQMGIHRQTDACADLSFAAKLGSQPAIKALAARCK